MESRRGWSQRLTININRQAIQHDKGEFAWKVNRSIAKAEATTSHVRKYNKTVRSLLAILLLTVINFPLITPAVIGKARPELPPCCRMTGKHKCALERTARHLESEHSGSRIGARCPFTSNYRAITTSPHRLLLSISWQCFAHRTLLFAAEVYLPSFRPLLFGRAHYKRGPPVRLT